MTIGLAQTKQATYAQETVVTLQIAGFGNVVIELFPEDAPITIDNFLGYVDSGFYDGLIFHRVIENFVIQTGAYDTELDFHEPNDPIVGEADNNLQNDRGTVAMALSGGDPNSGTSQFYINHNQEGNHHLDGLHTVFGRVRSGMDIVDQIAATATHTVNGMTDVPVDDVIITRAARVQADLTVAAVNEPNDIIAEPGENITLPVRLQNNGSAEAAHITDPNQPIYTSLYLTTADTFDPNDPTATSNQLLDEFSVTSLVANNNYDEDITFEAPSEPGTYYINIMADRSETVIEYNETNNAVTIPLTVAPDQPDLLLADPCQTLYRIELDHSVEIPIEIRNIGFDQTGPFEMWMYLATDPAFVPSFPADHLNDRLVQPDQSPFAFQSPALPDGMGFTIENLAGRDNHSETVTFNASLDVGTYYLTSYADDANNVLEYDETNNAGQLITLVLEPNQPDLIILDPQSARLTAQSAGQVQLTVQVQNDGHNMAQAAEPFVVEVLISEDPCDFENAEVAAQFTIGSLDEAVTHTEAIEFTAPIDIGTYYLAITADADGQIAEFNELNNQASPITLDVSAEPTDIDVSRFLAIAGVGIGSDCLYIVGRLEADLDDAHGQFEIAGRVRITAGAFQEDLQKTQFNSIGRLYIYQDFSAGGLDLVMLDLNTGVFTVFGRSLDLTGLAAPLDMRISFGGFLGQDELTESVINGAALMPIKFMQGYKDSLRVVGAYVALNSATGLYSLRLLGEISLLDGSVDLTAESVQINWGSLFNETIAAGGFKKIGSMFVYLRPAGAIGEIASAMFDMTSGRVYLDVREASLSPQSGTVTFRMQFADFDQTSQ